jgi:hypothetical protein
MNTYHPARRPTSTWTAVLAELSPLVALAIAIAGWTLLYVHDTRSPAATLVLGWIGLYGVCGCGVGWMISGRRGHGAALCVARMVGVPITGVLLIAGVLSGVDCGQECMPSGAVLLALLVAFVAALLMPVASAGVLFVTLRSRET